MDDDEIDKDSRFLAGVIEPQFRKSRKDDDKVVVDERFASLLLNDSRFKIETKDKYGRDQDHLEKNKKESKKKKKKKRSKKEEKDMSAFYTIQKQQEENETTKETFEKDEDYQKQKQENDEIDKNNNEDDEDSKEENVKKTSQKEEEEKKDDIPISRIAYLTALSRGEIDTSSSSSEEDEIIQEENDLSSDDDDDSLQDDDDDNVVAAAGILDPSHTLNQEKNQLPMTTVPSRFIAVMNLDWEKIRAIDIFAILSSFAPSSLQRVRVFPSNYGLERMASDKMYGPTGIWKNDNNKTTKQNDNDNDDSDDNDNNDNDNDQSQDDHDDNDSTIMNQNDDDSNAVQESDFDTEKLRAYEVSKLKYYFAIAEFATTHDADVVYQQVDGMEFERSSSVMDLRSIEYDNLQEMERDVIGNKTPRDEATFLPRGYKPPDFIVNALSHSNVQCTWEDGDAERQYKLTRYNNVHQSDEWQTMAERDNHFAMYLASDNSSQESEDDDEDDKKGTKAFRMRKILGLDSDGSSSEDDDDEEKKQDDVKKMPIIANDDDDENSEDGNKQVAFIPGSGSSLATKISAKLDKSKQEELTPWEKYKAKRKEKHKERRKAARERRLRRDEENDLDDEFFMKDDDDEKNNKSNQQSKPRDENMANIINSNEDDDDEDAKDYDMRGLIRLEKNKGKKLRGGRKRKEESLAANVAGGQFQFNVKDPRFAAVLDGSDDRFGIDKLDPNYEDTPAMQEILKEQAKRRKARKRQKVQHHVDNDNEENEHDNKKKKKKKKLKEDSSSLGGLVKSLKSKVSKKSR